MEIWKELSHEEECAMMIGQRGEVGMGEHDSAKVGLYISLSLSL